MNPQSMRSGESSAVSSSAAKATSRRAATWPAWPARLFIIALAVPWVVQVGPLAVTPYRAVLLVMIVPCFIGWARGKAGRITAVDLSVLAFCLWSVLSLAVNHGPEVAIEGGGILLIETAGAYFLGRCTIRTVDDFIAMAKLIFIVVAILLPFALIETLTSVNLAMDLFGAVLPTSPVSYDGLRMGLKRAQAVFAHPILLGAVTGSMLALAHLVVGRTAGAFVRWLASAVVIFTAFCSLSSAPFLVLAVQAALMMWAHFTRRLPHNWIVLLSLFALAYLVVELGSKQTGLQFYISRFSFDQSTAWLRLLIWEYGFATVLAHPWVGIGFGDWPRPSWMTSSIDMFWLANAMRHGIPAGVFMLAVPLLSLLGNARPPMLTEPQRSARLAYQIMLASWFIMGWTVHFWGSAYVTFLFIVGSGSWIQQEQAPRPLPMLRRATSRGGYGVAHLARRSP